MTLEYIGSIGGIAGILAVMMFGMVKYLIRQLREDRKFMEDRLTGILKDYNDANKSYKDALIDHTRVSSELYTYLKMRNGMNIGGKQ